MDRINMKAVSIQVYNINELDDEAKRRAYNHWLVLERDRFYLDKECIIDAIETRGFQQIADIEYNCSHSQGDGLCFTFKNISKDIVSKFAANTDKPTPDYSEVISLIHKGDIELTVHRLNYKYCHAYTYFLLLDYDEHTITRIVNKATLNSFERLLAAHYVNTCQEVHAIVQSHYDDSSSFDAFIEYAIENNQDFFSNGSSYLLNL